MKLVELLAREMSEWPEKASHAVQHEDGDVGFTYDGKPGRDKDHSDWSINALTASEKAYWLIGAATSASKTASDHATAIVTRADWEKEKMKQEAPKKNAEGWIRHNNKKQPVDDHVEVEIRTRSGDYEVCRAYGFAWDATGPDQIMAYRLHKPVEQVEACSKPELQIRLPDGYGEIIGCSVEGPLQWRDRITEIDSTSLALTTERAVLVQKLASEGFALIGRINELLTDAAQKHEDMSDPKNWRNGDIVECIVDHEGYFTAGSRYVVDYMECDWVNIHADDDGDENAIRPHKVKFHSRPSA